MPAWCSSRTSSPAPRAAPYRRAATSQKCVRAGGKHNDLDNVGYTARHHTFFEMLGNFSFGDYFKERAIELAWRLVTRDYGLAEERLLVTVYAEDDEAHALWRKIAGLPEERVLRIPTSDNFWAMGETGPCGPCSEIFYDHGPEIPGGPPGSADEDGDRFVEIWNLVFMQFEQVTPERRIDLPRPSIDTGMGLERIAAIMQGTNDNYETDLFRNLIAASVEMSGAAAEGAHRASHRVVADHLRASAFLIADGVMPSNEGRGYVLRRIMRRAMRHAQLMGCAEPLMWRLVPALVREMGQAFGELGRAGPLIAATLKLEETRFKETLARGLRLLDEATEGLPPGAPLPGETAFRLYDTFGFPLDLTEDALRAQGRTVERAGFDDCMERQRQAARRAWAGSGEAASDAVWFGIRERVGATEFLGYGTESAEAVVQALVAGGAETAQAEAGDTVALVLNQTPFYAEAGGQVGDTGAIVSAGGGRVRVTDTRREADGLHVHHAVVEEGTLAAGDAVVLTVDGPRRTALRANHSATHLLHAALRRALGDHVTQKGSLVAPDRLRFDISHPGAVPADALDGIEAEVNRLIRENTPLVTRLMSPEDAIEAGALALFGEKYGDEVRVVSMGHAEDDADAQALFGRALRRHPCGAHRRHRAVPDRGRIGVRRGNPAHRGADGGGGAAPRRRPRVRLAGGRGGAQGAAGRARRAHRRAGGGAQDAGAHARRDPPRTGHRRQRTAGGGPRDRRHGLRRPGARRRAAQGAAHHGRRPEEAARLRRLCRGEPHGRQGRADGRRQRRPHRARQRGRSRPRRRGGGRRQGRRRPGRHGAGRRPRRRAPGRGAAGDREGAGRRRLTLPAPAPAPTAPACRARHPPRNGGGTPRRSATRWSGAAAKAAMLPTHE